RIPSTKLVGSLYPKRNMLVHYRLLQFYISKGAIVTKVHSVITFKQKILFKDYIENNARKRRENPTEGWKWKLLSNALYGYTCIRVENHKQCKLVVTEKEAERVTREPWFTNFPAMRTD